MTIRNSQTYDNLLLLKDAGAVTADGAATVATVARVLDLGLARMEAKVVLEASAIDTTTGDETYRVSLQGCDVVGFGSGVVELGSVLMTAAERKEIHFVNQVGSTIYQFVRLYTDVTGTTPSLNYTGFIAKT